MNAVDDDDDNDGIPDDIDDAPLTPANRPPTITGDLPRYVVSGLYYENFLEGTDPDGDVLREWSTEGGPGDIRATVDPIGNDPGTVLPPPPFEGHTITVTGFAARPPGVYPITITITDGNDLGVYETDLEVVAAADAPILKTHPPTVGFRGEAYSGVLEATNPRGTDLVWTIESGPEWLSIDPSTGELSGTIPPDHRSVLEPFPQGGFSMELQLEYCRNKVLIGSRDSCPVDTVGIGIDDGTVKTVWPVYIDLFDTGEAQGPVVDGNTFHEVVTDAVFTDSLDFIYTVGASGGSIDGNNGLGLDDAFVKKVDSRQVEQWTTTVGSNRIDRVVSSTMDINEDIYLYLYSNGDWRSLVGDTSDPASNKRLIVKVSSSGEILWAVELADSTDVFIDPLPRELEVPYLAPLPGGGVRVLVNGELLDIDTLGSVSNHASANLGYDVWRIGVADDGSTILTGVGNITRLDNSGVEQWTVEFDADPQVTWYGRALAFDGDGNIVVLGEGHPTGADGRGWFMGKFAPDGSQSWFSPFTIDDEQKFQEFGPNGLAIDTLGNIVVAGRIWLETFTTASNGGDYNTVIKFDPSGNLLWYQELWRVDGNKYMSITNNSTDDLVVIGGGDTGVRIEYPGQYECSDQEPCSRELRNARNVWATLNTGTGGFGYYLVSLDTDGAEK